MRKSINIAVNYGFASFFVSIALLVVAVILIVTSGQKAAAACQPVDTSKGVVTAKFNVAVEGPYSVWALMKAASATNDSFILEVDGDNCGIVVGDGGVSTSNLQWVNYKNGSTASKMRINLSAGEHTLKLIGREDNVEVNSILMLADESCIPKELDASDCITSVDDGKPAVEIIQPKNGDKVSNTTELRATASDESGIAKVEYFLANDLLGTANVVGQEYVYSLDTKNLVNNQSYAVTARAYDEGGNIGENTINVTVSNDVIVTPPTDTNPTGPQVPSAIPASYTFNSNVTGWEPQGNSTISYVGTDGNTNNGSLQMTADKSGPFQNTSKTIRAGTLQWEKGLTTLENRKISANMSVKALTTGRKAHCEIRYYNMVNGRKIVSTVAGESRVLTKNNWNTLACSSTAPAGTTNVALRLFTEDTPYGEKFLIDDVNIIYGTIDELPVLPETNGNDTDGGDPVTPTPPEPPSTTDTEKPTKPSNLSRTLGFDITRFGYAINLSWNTSTDNSGAIEKYIISRNGKKIGETANTSFKDSNVTSNVSYTYSVQAVDPSGNASDTSVITAKGSCFFIWCTLL